jgi:prophage regulatory protein
MTEITPNANNPTFFTPADRLMRLPKLLKIAGISRATAYRYVRSGRLPAPVRLSPNCVAWKTSAINEWMAQLPGA